MYNKRKAFGQHFLISEGIADKIVSSLDTVPGKTVLEVGPGRGFLTERLLRAGYNVVGVEKDSGLVEYLREKWAGRLKILEGDILNINLRSFVLEFNISAIVSNLPYVISTRFIEKIIRELPPVEEMVLMFQKEVADKLVSPPGSRFTGPLSIAIQEFFYVKKLFNVKPGAFNPPPSVQSSVLKFFPRSSVIERSLSGKYLDFLFLLFKNRRKKIKHKFNFEKCNLRREILDKRAEEIESDMVRMLFKCYLHSFHDDSV